MPHEHSITSKIPLMTPYRPYHKLLSQLIPDSAGSVPTPFSGTLRRLVCEQSVHAWAEINYFFLFANCWQYFPSKLTLANYCT